MKEFLRFAALLALPALLAAQTVQPAPGNNPASASQPAPGNNPASASQPAPSSEPGITRQQADDILNLLRQIRQLLIEERQAADAKRDSEKKKVAVNLKGYEPLGKKRAPVTMVEFTDYQCPYCQRFNTATFAELKKKYIDTGKVRFYSRDFPLEFHENAFRAAEAGRCAGDQGKFWKFRELMAADPTKLEMADLMESASRLKLDTKAFRACIESEKYKSKIDSDMQYAFSIGAEATPTFVIGKSTPDGVEGELIEGALPFAWFAAKIEQSAAK